jgi:hypothetical protein
MLGNTDEGKQAHYAVLLSVRKLVAHLLVPLVTRSPTWAVLLLP